MSVCDVPLCPSLSVGGQTPLMAAPKGVPRVNKPCSETRDRLRIRLSQRKAKYSFNPNVSYSVQMGALSKIAEQGDKDKKALKVKQEQPVADERPITAAIKKAGVDLFSALPLRRSSVKRSDSKDRKDKDKENSPIDETENDNVKNITPKYEDIDKIMKFIEGKDYELAQKKAAKKARQKQKKEEEKRKKEEEERARIRAEQERIREEKRLQDERIKAEQLLAAKKARKGNKHQQKQPSETESNKNKKKNKKNRQEETSERELIEETIPAMVTIKRIVENNNSPPTVTITLKGSTPDQDKLLYTLVNGHDNSDKKSDGNHKVDNKLSKKKKKSGNNLQESITTKELKVTLSVDKSFRKELENNKNKTEQKNKHQQVQQQQQQAHVKAVSSSNKETIIDIPSLKLPPGITITKVNGPLTNKKTSNVQSSDFQNVPVNKSGVIVVDTEKLIQQSIGSKKSKRKKKKNQGGNQNSSSDAAANGEQDSTMVTLKNPIFHRLQGKMTTPVAPDPSQLLDINEQATISKGANGMVTIRRPRQVALQNEAPPVLSDYVIRSNAAADPKSTLSEDRKIIRPPSPRSCRPPAGQEFDASRLCTQNILWGLPGIQITRVHKGVASTRPEGEHANQAADVSIIRTGGFNLDKDDWPYESVFTPKDVPEDDLDADERELEAFKRFCQQSVPPKHKEKVAHLNVKDIVLMKKNDVTYS